MENQVLYLVFLYNKNMDREILSTFKSLKALFNKNGFQLFFVGGTVRDYLLNLEIKDLDVVSDAKPEEMELFLEDANYTFRKYGFVKLNYQGYKFDITTLRKEEIYQDFRHPKVVVFCKTLQEDVKRRDFTINGLYMDDDLKIYDFINGEADIKNKIIKTIGVADIRIKEDPLRIYRAIRFMINLGFQLDEDLSLAIKNNASLTHELNPQKIKEEIRKCLHPNKMIEILKGLDILC